VKVRPPYTVGTRKGLLWGFFSSSTDEVTHLLVVNLDHGKEITRTIVGSGAMEEFYPHGRNWHPVSDGSRAELTIVAGGGRLLRLRDSC
jgi:hypothetical protein